MVVHIICDLNTKEVETGGSLRLVGLTLRLAWSARLETLSQKAG